MATLNISIPAAMRKWIDRQVGTGEYANVSDYMRDLIRHDQRQHEVLKLALIEGERSGTSKKIKARQRYELAAVENGVAKINVVTQILTPVNNPEIKTQLVQRESEGTIRFDIASGRVIGQKIDLDRSVVGYPNPKSRMRYRTRFTEELLKAGARTAAKPKSQDKKSK